MKFIRGTVVYLALLIAMLLIFSAGVKSDTELAERNFGESQECYNQKTASSYTGRNHRTQSCINQEKIGNQFGFIFQVLGFGFIGFSVVALLFMRFERWLLEDSEIEPDFKKEFESKFEEYGLFHENPIKKSNVIDNMLKIDLVDYAKNEGILVKSKDSKKDIIESVLKLKLKKELKVDLIRYCNLIGVYVVSRNTKEQVIDKLIEFKKQNIRG